MLENFVSCAESCGFVLQVEVEKLSLEECRLDDQIRLYVCSVLH